MRDRSTGPVVTRGVAGVLVAALGGAPPVAAAPVDRTYEGPTETVAAATDEPAVTATDPSKQPDGDANAPIRERPSRPEPTAEPDAEDLPVFTPARFVIANYYGFAIGPPRSQILGATLFLGASLPRTARPGNFIAIGTQGEYSPYAPYRQHLTVQGVAGPASGLFYSVGAGLVVHRFGEHLTGGEAEVRLGYAFTKDGGARIRGVFGGMLRGGLASYRDREGDLLGPVVQAGLFVGFTRAPVGLPARADAPDAPRRGLGCLIPGIILLAGVAGTIVFDIATLSGTSDGEGCHGCVPLMVYALPALVPGVPLTVIGTIRLRRYREWRDRMTFAPRATGFSMQF